MQKLQLLLEFGEQKVLVGAEAPVVAGVWEAEGSCTCRLLAGVVGAEAPVVAGVWEAEGSCRLLAGVEGAEGNVGG